MDTRRVKYKQNIKLYTRGTIAYKSKTKNREKAKKLDCSKFELQTQLIVCKCYIEIVCQMTKTEKSEM